MGLIVGVGLVGATFYVLLSSHYLGATIGRTLGPYTDTLAHVALTHPDPDMWQQISQRHGVAILAEPAGGEPVAFNGRGEPVSPPESLERLGHIRSVRTGADGTRITFFWTQGSFQQSHYSLLAGLLVMLTLVVASAFWFLHRQLKPLAWLHSGVDAVARGDFRTRVPVVRRDEIGQVAEAFNVMAGRVGNMIDDRERLLADVSHELRSPISRMKVALEFMPEGDKRDALGRDLKEMENLIAVLLEREELRSRTGRVKGEDVDLDAIAGEVVSFFAGQGPGVELVPNGTATVHADPELIKVLLQNLVENAVKFSQPDSRPVVVKVETGTEKVTLRVIDDGMGIPAGNEQQIFEPFVKLDRARGHRVGYGIGLNLCQRIVQLHGGAIQLNRRDPRGTEAVVTFPRAD